MQVLQNSLSKGYTSAHAIFIVCIADIEDRNRDLNRWRQDFLRVSMSLNLFVLCKTPCQRLYVCSQKTVEFILIFTEAIFFLIYCSRQSSLNVISQSNSNRSFEQLLVDTRSFNSSFQETTSLIEIINEESTVVFPVALPQPRLLPYVICTIHGWFQPMIIVPIATQNCPVAMLTRELESLEY